MSSKSFQWNSVDHWIEADAMMRRSEIATMIVASLWVCLMMAVREHLSAVEALLFVIPLFLSIALLKHWDRQGLIRQTPMGDPSPAENTLRRNWFILRYLTRGVAISLGMLAVLCLAHDAWNTAFALLNAMLAAAPLLSIAMRFVGRPAQSDPSKGYQDIP